MQGMKKDFEKMQGMHEGSMELQEELELVINLMDGNTPTQGLYFLINKMVNLPGS